MLKARTGNQKAYFLIRCCSKLRLLSLVTKGNFNPVSTPRIPCRAEQKESFASPLQENYNYMLSKPLPYGFCRDESLEFCAKVQLGVQVAFGVGSYYLRLLKLAFGAWNPRVCLVCLCRCDKDARRRSDPPLSLNA